MKKISSQRSQEREKHRYKTPEKKNIVNKRDQMKNQGARAMERSKNNSPEKEPQQVINKRLFIIYILVFVVFAVLIGRLFYMQIIQGEAYSERENNITRTVELEARRGVITIETVMYLPVLNRI